MKLSVAMCTYNGAEFLPAQLESIIAQSRPPDEIIICDDGSTDQTTTLLNQFSSASSVAKIHINKTNLGTIKNFEQAIAMCTGDIIVLSDQDDVWRNDKLQMIDDAFRANPTAGLVFSDAEIVDQNLNPLNRHMWNEVGFDAHKRKLVRTGRALEVLITGWTVTGATMAFRSNFTKLSLPIPTDIAMIHDGWIALTIAAVAPVVMLDEPLIKYRQHERQQIGAPTRTHASTAPAGIEAALRRRNNTADLHKILTILAERLSANANLYDTRSARSFVSDYSFHLNVRANLPQRRLNRVPGILRELLSLRYHEYANGFKSAAKDLVS